MYPLAISSWGVEEVAAIDRVVKSNRYTMGDEVIEFEREFARYMSVSDAVMVNSGSSANLIMLSALIHSDQFDLRPGDNVLVPAVSWSTTYFPLHQLGLKMTLVDVDPTTFNIDPKAIVRNITEKTRAIFAVNLLGNPCNFEKIRDICKQYNLILIEDNCESFGATYGTKRELNRIGIYEERPIQAGTMGIAGTYSFFFSHHLQTMEGGMIVTNDPVLADYMRSLRAHGWIRDLRTDKLYKKTKDPFEDSFKFILPGYCVRPLEMSAAIGREQLIKMPYHLEMRQKNASLFKQLFANHPNVDIQQVESGGTSSWFGFSVILKNALYDKRKELVAALRVGGVETRPIVAGNFARQPVMKYLLEAGAQVDTFLGGAETLDKQGLFFGNTHTDLTAQLLHVHKIIYNMEK